MVALARRNVEKRSLLERLDAAFLIVDELVDRGYEELCNNCSSRIVVTVES